jgi:hypothetical protein
MRLFMNIITICLLGLTMLTPGIALSHSNHGEPLNDKQALIVASKYLEIMVEKSETHNDGKLDSSWTKVTEKEIFKKSLRYFIVSFRNTEKQKTLYMLLNIYGEYIAANFKGEFKGL